MSKAEFAYTETRRRITSGEFKPGERLVIQALATSLDLSPVPMREALRRLEAEGLVRYKRNIGYEVLGIDPFEFGEAMEAVALLEGRATALAAAHLSDSDLSLAEGINDQLESLLGRNLDSVKFTRLNQEFHRILWSACPNRPIIKLLRNEMARLTTLRRSSFSYIPERAHQSVEEHRVLLDWVRERPHQLDEIEKLARKHKLRTRDALLTRSAPVSEFRA